MAEDQRNREPYYPIEGPFSEHDLDLIERLFEGWHRRAILADAKEFEVIFARTRYQLFAAKVKRFPPTKAGT